MDTIFPQGIVVGTGGRSDPYYDYGPEYYAVLFEDPDGNKLEVCCVGPEALAAG